MPPSVIRTRAWFTSRWVWSGPINELTRDWYSWKFCSCWSILIIFAYPKEFNTMSHCCVIALNKSFTLLYMIAINKSLWLVMYKWVQLTNWIPVSGSTPIPADAKFAPTSSLSPFNSGFRYGKVGSAPSFWPTYVYKSFVLVNATRKPARQYLWPRSH